MALTAPGRTGDEDAIADLYTAYLCTYGFNATRGGIAGFVTNSHCTTKQGGTEGTHVFVKRKRAHLIVENGPTLMRKALSRTSSS